jgi:hypothetical protein
MPVINIEKAMVHLRVDEDTGGDVLAKLNSAEDKAAQYLNRFFMPLQLHGQRRFLSLWTS